MSATRVVTQTAIGGGTASLTFSNVTTQTGDRIVVLVATNGATPLPGITCEYGAVPFNDEGWAFDVGSITNATSDALVSGTSFTGITADVVVRFLGGNPTVAVAALIVWRGLVPDFFVIDGSQVAATSGTIATIDLDTTVAPEMFEALLVTAGPSSDAAGTWGNGFTPGLRVGHTLGGFSVTLAEGYMEAPTIGAISPEVVGFTSRENFFGVGGYQESAAARPRACYTTYDLGLFDMGSPHTGALPEVAKKVAQGDLRFVPGRR